MSDSPFPLRPDDPVAVWRRAAAFLYGWGHRLHRRLTPPSVRVPGARVLSVGNLVVGGVGKTPCVLWLAERLARHERTAVVCRPVGPPTPSGESDEVALLREKLPEAVAVVADARKWIAARRAGEVGARAIVVDDGFSHSRLHRDLDLVLLDARAPFANGRLVPAGPLREPPGAVARADAVVLTRADLTGEEGLARARAAVRRYGFEGPMLLARHRLLGLTGKGYDPALEPYRVVCVSGLARGGELARAARSLGHEVVAAFSVGDHGAIDRRAWGRWTELARTEGARVLITEKDAVRLEKTMRESALVLRMEWEWLDGDVDPEWLVRTIVAPESAGEAKATTPTS